MRSIFALLMATATALPALAASTCNARPAGGELPTIVELYTSEGCNSCPPADRFLSSLVERPDVLGLAFHVDYWDRLGWKDRFASPAYTERQQLLQRASGARFIYTPQVIVNGRDSRDWPTLPAPAASAADIELSRDGGRVDALITPRSGAPARLAAYWVALEDGHVSEVRSGENAGVTLRHDSVVRAYREAPAWSGREPHRLSFEPPAAERGRAAKVALVIVDAATQRPVAAARLDC